MKYLLFCLFSLSLLQAVAQDTAWVQTFTFDSITTRRANFQFPASLDTERFEKVLMYYKLKCSPLTTWDQYNCGEWDYLTYTRVFDHTGQLDSTAINGQLFLANMASPNTIPFKPYPYTEADTYAVSEWSRSALNLVYNTLVDFSSSFRPQNCKLPVFKRGFWVPCACIWQMLESCGNPKSVWLPLHFLRFLPFTMVRSLRYTSSLESGALLYKPAGTTSCFTKILTGMARVI